MSTTPSASSPITADEALSIYLKAPAEGMTDAKRAAADANKDGVVDLKDVRILVDQEKKNAPEGQKEYPAYDTNKDGKTDLTDVLNINKLNLNKTVSGLNAESYVLADSNNDGKITTIDVINAQGKYLGKNYDSILKQNWFKTVDGNYIHPITKEIINEDQYLEKAYTNDANNYRATQLRKELVKSNFTATYSDSSLTNQQKAQKINEYLTSQGSNRDELASVMGLQINDINAFLDLDPVYAKQTLQSLGLNTNDIYKNPKSNADETNELNSYLVGQLRKQGIFDANSAASKSGTVLFDDQAGTKYIVTENGIAKQFDPVTRVASQLVALGYIDPNSSGGAWTTQKGGFGAEGMVKQLASRLISQTGIQDINELVHRTVNKPQEVTLQARHQSYGYDYEGNAFPEGPQIGWNYITTETDSEGNGYSVAKPVSFDAVTKIYTDENGQTRGTVSIPVTETINSRTGKPVNVNLGGWAQGPEFTWATFGFDANGKPRISTYGESSSDLGAIMPILAIGLMAFPGIGQAIGSYLLPAGTATAVTTAVGNAIITSSLSSIATGAPLTDALKNIALSAGAAYAGQVVGNMLPKELAAVGASAVSQLIQTGKIDLTSLAIAGAQGVATNAVAKELNIPTTAASAIVGAGVAALSGKEQQALQILQNGAVATAINGFAKEANLTPQEKNFLAMGVGQAISIAKTGQLNPLQVISSLRALGVDQPNAARIAGAEATQRSNTIIGAVAVDKNGELYTMYDDGSRLMLSGNDAGKAYTAEEWQGIQSALNAGQANYVNSLINAMNNGTATPQEVTSDLKGSGYSDATIASIFKANEQFIDRAKKAQDIAKDYTAVGSDMMPEGAIQRLMAAGFSQADAGKYVTNLDKQVTARNNYTNTANDFINGKATESQLESAMSAAGLKGEVATDQLAYYRAIKAGDELTPSEATNVAVANLNQWQVIDRKGTQVVWDRNDEGDFYVKSARDAAGKDITNTFYGSTPQAIDRYRVQEQQQYVDRLNKQQTRTAEQFFAPGSSMTNDQAIAALKANDGMTDAMARQVVAGWNDQKAAIGKNSITFDQANRTSNRIMTFEEFEKVLGGVNVKTDLVTRYQAYLYTNGELIRTGNLPNGQYVLPGEVVEALNKGKPGAELPRNTFIDEVAKGVYEGIKAGAAVGTPAQNFINSLNANFLGLFPRTVAGIQSRIQEDAADDIAVAARGIAEIFSKSSDVLGETAVPGMVAEANKRMEDIRSASGLWNKSVAAWKWATDSPLSFTSLLWASSKELTEDLVLSQILIGKALQAVGTAPMKAFGLTMTDIAINYGGIIEENIAQLTQEGLDPRLSAIVAGNGAMPAALAESIIGGLMSALPIDKVSKNSLIKQMVATPYQGAVDAAEEGGSYLASQLGMGQKANLNDFLTAAVIGGTVGTKAHIQAEVLGLLSPTGQGDVLKTLDRLGFQVTIDPSAIDQSAKGTVTSLVGNTAVIKGPSNQTYVADIGNQNISAGQQINIYSLDTTPVKITPEEMNGYLSLVNEAYQGQLGRNPTPDEVSFAIKDLSGVGQLQEQLNATQEGQRFDKVVETFNKTIGRNPTSAEIKANLTRLNNNEITIDQLKQELAKTNEGVLFEQKQIFNAQTDAQIASDAKTLLDQGKITYADFKTFMNTMGLAGDRQLNVLDTITPRATVSGTVTSIVGDNAIVTGADGKMYTMLRVGPNNYLLQKGDVVNLGVSTVKPDAAPTVEVTTKIADVNASISLSTLEAKKAYDASVSLSISEADYAKSVSLSISQAAHDTSVSQSISKANNDISVSQSISQAAYDISVSQSISQAAHDTSVSQSISKANHDKELKEARDLSISESISKAGYEASVSQSISQAAHDISVSQSISKANNDISVSQSLSQAAHDISVSQSISQAAHDISVSQSISQAAHDVSVSQSISKLEDDQKKAKDQSISESISQAAYDASVSESLSTSQSISKVAIDESISKALRDDFLNAISLSASISASESISQSISMLVAQSISQSISDQAVKVSEPVSDKPIVDKISQPVSEVITEPVTEKVTEKITEKVTELVTEKVTEKVTEPVTEKVTVTVTENITETNTIIITTTSLPPVTTTITIPPVTAEEATTEPVTTATIPPVTPPPTSSVVTIPPVTTPSISITELTTTFEPTTTATVTTTAPVTTTKAPTTSKPATATTAPPFPLFGIPAAAGQQKTYVDYAQPNVPAPQFGPYDLFKAPNYLRPLQDTGNFGLAALIGATNDAKQGDGSNQSQQNAQGQNQGTSG